MSIISRDTLIEQAIARDVATYTLEEIAERHGYTYREVYQAMKRLEIANEVKHET